MLDLDDVLVRAADLLGDDPGFAERMQWRYRHLSVDEFQDVNPAQFRLILALAGTRLDLCAVGDPNQAIYGWNGADPRLLDRLPDLVAGLEVVRLDENHRSSPRWWRRPPRHWGHRSPPPPRSMAADGPDAGGDRLRHDVAEAEGVAALLADRSAEGVRWSDQAVLARTHDNCRWYARPWPGPASPTGWPPGPGAGDRPRSGSDDRSRRRRAGHLPPGQGPRVDLGVRGGPGGRVRAHRLRRIGHGPGRGTTPPLCGPDPCLPGPALLVVTDPGMGRGQAVERQPSPWLAAVARVSRTGLGRTTPRDAGRRIAEIRAGLGN